jgi:ribonuclease-3
LNQDLAQLQRVVGHEFRDLELLKTALTHRSVGARNNERMEFLGDAVLGFIAAEALFHDHEKAREGDLSRLRAALVKGETLAAIARSISLGDYLTLGAGEVRSGGHARSSILADALEAIFAAVYLDGGMDAVREVIMGLLGERLQNLTLEDARKDPKTRLQEYLQKRKFSLPEYAMIKVEGEAHDQTFTVVCRVEELSLSREGAGGSRRKAEQAAARSMLEQLS